MKNKNKPSMKVLEGEVKGFAFKLEHKYIKRKIKIREEKKIGGPVQEIQHINNMSSRERDQKNGWKKIMK